MLVITLVISPFEGRLDVSKVGTLVVTCLVRLLLLGRCGDMLLAVEVLSTYLWSWAVLMPDADEVGANTDEAEDDVMAWLEWRSIDWEDDDTATMWLSGGWRSNFWGPPAATEAAPPTECSWVGIIDGRSFSLTIPLSDGID